MEPTLEPAPIFAVYDNPSDDEIATVAAGMRDEDQRECAAWNLDPGQAAQAMASCEHKWVVYRKQYPVFVFGLKQFLPGAYYVCGFASSDIDKCTLSNLTRWGIKEWLPTVFYQLDARRLEALVPIASTHSIKWLTWCGMKIEGSSRDYVQRGDVFVRLSYSISAYEADDADVLFLPTEGRTAGPRARRPEEVQH